MAFPVYGYLGFSLSTIISILMMSMLIHLIYNECLEHKRNAHNQKRSIISFIKSLPAHTTVAILVLLSFSINALNFVILSFYDILIIQNQNNDKTINDLCYNQISINSSMTAGKILAYIFFIINTNAVVFLVRKNSQKRLYQVFKGSPMEVSKKRMQCFAILTTLPFFYLAILFSYAMALVVENIDRNKIEIKTFEQCSEVVKERMIDDNVFYVFKMFGIALYTLNAVAYSVIILKLFLSKVILLSLTFKDFEQVQISHYSRLPQSVGGSSVVHGYTDSGREVGDGPMVEMPTVLAHVSTNSDIFTVFGDKKLGAAKLAAIKRENTAFLHTAIKTANLVILAVITNFIALLMSATNFLPAYFFLIDTFCNCLSVYLSFKYSQRIYGCIFGHIVHDWCLICCASICVCCCLPKTLPEDIKLVLYENSCWCCIKWFLTRNESNKSHVDVDFAHVGIDSSNDIADDVCVSDDGNIR